MNKEFELQLKYYAAVKRFKEAEWVEAAAKKERVEQWDLIDKTQYDNNEYFFAWAEKHKVEIALLEKVEQKYAAEYTRDLCYADWMKHKHGVDSTEAQIAQHRAELARTREFVYSDDSPYWTKWYKLKGKVRWVWNQLKLKGYYIVAAEIERSREVFCNRIEEESNCEGLSSARNAAVEALNKWEQEDDRTDWNEAKPKYDAELAKWNEFKPKGEEYAEVLEEKICKCVRTSLTVHATAQDYEISTLKNELSQKGREAQQIGELHGRTNELDATVEEMRTWIQSLIHMNQSLINGQCKQLEEFEASARTTLEQEWQIWLERTTSTHTNLVNWIQERIAEMAALEKEEAAARNDYKHEFYDSIKEIDNRRLALKEMLGGSIFD